jgi:hypothetical protein
MVAKEKAKASAIMTPVGVVCFANVFTPRAYQPGQPPAYSMLLVFDKKGLEDEYFKGNKLLPHARHWKDLRNAVSAAAIAKFGKEEAARLAKRGKLSLPWRDGSDYEEYGEPFSEKSVFIRLTTRTAPGVVSAQRRPILDDGEFYSGCLARATAGVWAFDTAGNKGVTLLLNNVQKVGDGEHLSGRRAAEDEFEDAEVGSGDDDETDPFA